MKAMSHKFNFASAPDENMVTRDFKVSPFCGELSAKNEAGIYKMIKGQEKYYFFQEKHKEPPIAPCFYKEKDKWKAIDDSDQQMCLSFFQRMEVQKERDSRQNKRKRMDEVDVSLNINQQVDNMNIENMNVNDINLLQ